MTDQDMASCASLCKEISANVDLIQQFERIGPEDWMTQRQIWSVYNVSSPIARQSDHNSFVQCAQNLYENNKRDDVQRRVRLVELVIYKANKRCSTRDHKALLVPHRDDRIGGDVSLVIGLARQANTRDACLGLQPQRMAPFGATKKVLTPENRFYQAVHSPRTTSISALACFRGTRQSIM